MRADESELGMGSKGDPNKWDVVWGMGCSVTVQEILDKDSSGNCSVKWSMGSFKINGTTVFDLSHTSYPNTRNSCLDSDTLARERWKWNTALLQGGCAVFCLLSL